MSSKCIKSLKDKPSLSTDKINKLRLDLIEEERQDFTDRLDQEQAESTLGHPGGALFVLVALLGAALSSRVQRPRA